jgi:hypothetical protein
LLALPLVCASCGGTAFTFSTTAQTPLRTSLARALCPAEPLITSPGSSETLVPGHPIGALLCRYASPSPGPFGAPLRLVSAVRVLKQDVINHLVGELNALPPRGPIAQSCPDFNGRSSLIVFRYHGAGHARVRISYNGCAHVTNGQIERAGDSLHRIEQTYWPDEGLL